MQHILGVAPYLRSQGVLLGSAFGDIPFTFVGCFLANISTRNGEHLTFWETSTFGGGGSATQSYLILSDRAASSQSAFSLGSSRFHAAATCFRISFDFWRKIGAVSWTRASCLQHFDTYRGTNEQNLRSMKFIPHEYKLLRQSLLK